MGCIKAAGSGGFVVGRGFKETRRASVGMKEDFLTGSTDGMAESREKEKRIPSVCKEPLI